MNEWMESKTSWGSVWVNELISWINTWLDGWMTKWLTILTKLPTEDWINEIANECVRAKSFQSCLILCDPMDCMQPARFLSPCNSPGKNTGVSCHALLQGIFLTQGSHLQHFLHLHWQVGSLPRGAPGKPREWMTESELKGWLTHCLSELVDQLNYGCLKQQNN